MAAAVICNQRKERLPSTNKYLKCGVSTINSDKNKMRKFTFLLTVLIAMTITTNAQIPNNGFENWTTIGSYENPTGWNNCNSYSTGLFFPVTKSLDHYPPSVGDYSIRIENQIPLSNCSSYGFAQTCDNSNPGTPAFPIIGHPTSLCGYYKCFPQNNDTIQIGIMLFHNGDLIAGAELLCTDTIANWTSFNIPISTYTFADSATIAICAFYNDTTAGIPYGPFGNSVLYVDNLSFDNLITSISEQNFINPPFSLFPNPAYGIVNINIDNENNDDMTLNIYSVIGTLIRTEILKKNQRQVNISELNNGTYMIEIKSKEWTEKQKLIIQR